jgi:hypothetical protein
MSMTSRLQQSARRIVFLPALTIAAAVAATATPPITQLGGMTYLAVIAKFLYGAGGTTVDAYLQTSINGGASWIDIMEFNFTTAAATKVSAVSTAVALAAVAVPGDGALTVNTILNGLLGDRLRLKYVTVGTYSGATSLAVDALVKG